MRHYFYRHIKYIIRIVISRKVQKKELQDQMRKRFKEKAKKNGKDLDESSEERKCIWGKGYSVNQWVSPTFCLQYFGHAAHSASKAFSLFSI